jgi:xanthine dehydrogenase accessory factor
MSQGYAGCVIDPIFEALAAAAATGQPVALAHHHRREGFQPAKNRGEGPVLSRWPHSRAPSAAVAWRRRRNTAARHRTRIRTGQPGTAFDLVLDHDFGWDDGLICGGKVLGVVIPNVQQLGENFWNNLATRDSPKTWGVNKDFTIQQFDNPTNNDFLYQEIITPPCELWIAGSGHIAQAVAPLALKLDFAVSIFDDRPELANHELFPKETAIHVGNWGDVLGQPFPDSPTLGLIVTRGHNHDALVLESWIKRPFAFLGMIGSKRKWRMISEKFQSAKIATAEELVSVACPVGIPIRSKSITEIAVSIAAQLIDKRAEILRQ